ncbi:IPExxxVDY family protein [Psychroflexus tropicus]|uniref:IPExxxVDY family protein n=1 Tax=Psychroflexus tropicus TaxID=197345 RepID=UPI000475CEDA|nr:IPExxxVDY family protein [Psychroflexus tropicus]
MKKRRFSLSDFEFCDFKLIGLHSQQEPHKIAYFINLALETNFKRVNTDLELIINGKTIHFPIFEFFNKDWDTKSYLISNKVNVEEKVIGNSLFAIEDYLSQEFLLSDHKRVDYLLKINDDLNIFDPKLIIDRLVKMRQISMAYTIETDAIKHPEHLILD